MFRLEGVIIRLPLKPYLRCTKLLCTFGIPNVHSYFVQLNMVKDDIMMMTFVS